MKPIDRSLQKLLDAAAQRRRELPESPPFGFETAAIARWRDARKEDELALLLWLFPRATIFAVAVMILSGAWNYFGSGGSVDTTALASYAMMQLPP